MSDRIPMTGALPAPARARALGELSAVQMQICERIMLGDSVRKICSDDDMPAQSTVFQWLVEDPSFQAAYATAKALLAETFAEDVVEIADDGSRDWIETEDGKELDREHVQRAKLRVDARKWAAAKLSPKRYGDRAVAMDAGGMTLNVITGVPRRELSQEEIVARLAAIAAGMGSRRK